MKKVALYLFIIVLLVLPLLLRVTDANLTLPGDDVYAYLLQEHVPGETLPVLGNIIHNLPFIVLLFLPFASILISFFLVMKILKELGIKKIYFFVFILVFALSPLTHSLAFFIDSNTFIFPFFLLGFFFLLRKNLFLAAIPLIFTSLISPAHAVFNIFLVLIIKKYWFNSKKINFLAVLFGLMFLLIHLRSLFLNFADINLQDIFIGFFSEFGSYFGFGIFEVFLAIFGFFALMKFKKQYYSLFWFCGFVILASFFLPNLRIYSLLIISFLNMTFLCYLYKWKWSLNWLKSLFFLTIFCGLLFANLSNAVTLSKAPPSLEFVQGLDLISGAPPGLILTLQDYGDFVEFYSGKKPLLRQEEVSSGFFSDYLNMFYSTELSETLDIMKKYYIKYVVITPEMKEKLWKRDDYGLIFLLNHSKCFKNLLSNDKVSVWEVDYAREV